MSSTSGRASDVQRQTILGRLDAAQRASRSASSPVTKQREVSAVDALGASSLETRSRGDDAETFVRGEDPHTECLEVDRNYVRLRAS